MALSEYKNLFNIAHFWRVAEFGAGVAGNPTKESIAWGTNWAFALFRPDLCCS